MDRKKRTRIGTPKSCFVFIRFHSSFAYVWHKALYLLCQNFVRNEPLVLILWPNSYNRGVFKNIIKRNTRWQSKSFGTIWIFYNCLLDHGKIDISGLSDSLLIWLVNIKFIKWELFTERQFELGGNMVTKWWFGTLIFGLLAVVLSLFKEFKQTPLLNIIF